MFVPHIVEQLLPRQPVIRTGSRPSRQAPQKVHLVRVEAVGSSLYYRGVLSAPVMSSVSSSWRCQRSAEAGNQDPGVIRTSGRSLSCSGFPGAGPRWKPRLTMQSGAGSSSVWAGWAGPRAPALGSPGWAVLREMGWCQPVGRSAAARQSLTWAVEAAAGSLAAA